MFYASYVKPQFDMGEVWKQRFRENRKKNYLLIKTIKFS